jgi:hypothetical protein
MEESCVLYSYVKRLLWCGKASTCGPGSSRQSTVIATDSTSLYPGISTGPHSTA